MAPFEALHFFEDLVSIISGMVCWTPAVTSLYDFSSLFFRSSFPPLGVFSGVPTELLVSVAPPSDSAPISEPIVVFSSFDFEASFVGGTFLFLAGFSEGDEEWEAISISSFSGSFGGAVFFPRAPSKGSSSPESVPSNVQVLTLWLLRLVCFS